jgi:hypothetical protein
VIVFEQSIFGDVLLISHSDDAQSTVRLHAINNTVMAAAAVATLAAGIIAVIALLLPPPLSFLFFALAATVPWLVIHDTLRFASLARGKPGIALRLDALWVILWVVGTYASHTSRSPTVYWLVWAGPCLVTSLYGLASQGVRPVSPARAWVQVMVSRKISLPLLADFAISGVLAQVIWGL